MRNSGLILCKNMKMDKNYQNVIDYSDDNLVALCRDEDHFIGEDNNYSFIRDRGYIKSSFKYEDCLLSNYIAFQNPEYSNKWFFAFVDKIEYISDNVTYIHYTVDEWSTWFGWWNQTDSFVLREHVNDDTIGKNTYPEGLETGEYICNEHILEPYTYEGNKELCYILAATATPLSGDVAKPGVYNGIYTGCSYYRYDNADDLSSDLRLYAERGKIDAIVGLFMAPKYLAPYEDGTGANPKVKESTLAVTNSYITPINTNINTYIPKNNKLFVFPYNYSVISNNSGQNKVLHYEKFKNLSVELQIDGVLNPSCSLTVYPDNYNGSEKSNIDSIMLGKFPICSYQNDMYTNWLTQNSVNILGTTVSTDTINVGSNILNAVSNITGKDIGGTINATGGIIGSLIQKKQHEIIPNSCVGQLNSGDVNTSNDTNCLHIYKMSIKKEYAKMIDDYFTKFGYQVNRLKLANMTGRQYYNYIQIDSSDRIGIGNIPANSMEVINNIARNGTTIWHNEYDIGNYDLDNQIVV